ncbi:putative LysR family transcriptional regulator [Candidatus Sulfopaludibacter sp. SbA3]|nr:putative LysR family transcriptional regulator [Candidatus Sulfopaludibacter sp. SbA3]
MEFHQLELFLAVIECASVTRAAEKVNLSPGAVSLQLHNLAAELRTDLFVRSGKHIVPTPAALRLAEHARSVTAQMRQIEQEFASDSLHDHLPFHFATGATALIHQLGRPLRLLRKNFPETSIGITVAPTEEMVAGLLQRRFDLALISLPFQNDDIDVIPLFEEELLVLKPSVRRVTGWRVGTIEPDDLAGASLVLYPKRSNMRSMIDGFCRELGVSPRVIMEADDTEAMKKLVETGFGYSILPEFALRGGPRFFQVFRVQGRRLARTQALAMAKSQHRRALTDSIAHFLKNALTPEK